MGSTDGSLAGFANRGHFLMTWRAIACAAGLLTTVPALAIADSARFDISAQGMPGALKEFAAQAHMQLLYQFGAVSGLKSNAVRGDLDKHDALEKLVQNTGLQVVFTSTDSAAIRPVSAQTLPADDQPNQANTNAGAKEGKSDSSGGFRVAPVDQASAGPRVAEKKEEIKEDRKYTLEEVVVTGSHLAIEPTQVPQDLQTYSREQIDQSGQITVTDFLNTLPMASVAASREGISGAGGTYGGGTTVNLRGLPSGTTLVLLNGRRLEGASAQSYYGNDFFDLNLLPMSVIERIDVVANGSSAIYGSDAIAGVVNIILKKTLDGVEATATRGWANGVDETDESLAIGKKWDRGSASLIGTYQRRGELDTSERALTASNDYTPYGGPNNNFPICNLGNVFSLTGQPLPGAAAGSTATYAAVSGKANAGKPTFTDFNYGSLNECSLAAGFSLIPATDRWGILAQADYDLTTGVQIFSELMYTDVKQYQLTGHKFLFGVPGFQSFSVSAANPYNPFGTAVGITEKFPTIPTSLPTETQFGRAVVGARGSLSDTWRWEIAALGSSDQTDLTLVNGFTDSAGIQNGLNSTDPATALNPFMAGPVAPQSVLQSYFSNGAAKFISRAIGINGFLHGTALTLPSGPVQVAVGSEFDRERLYTNEINDGVHPPNTQLNFSRNSYALFGEARVPLLAGSAALAPERIAATAAVRYDHYNDFGGTTNPQFGFELRPFETLLLRATYSDAFKAPPLSDLNNPATAVPDAVLVDPKSGQQISTTVVTGGNPNLRPLTGVSRSIGLVWTSSAVRALQLSATWWTVSENQAIQTNLAPQFVLNNESAFPGAVVRDSSGNIAKVIATAFNFGSIDVAGIDYHATYTLSSRLGDWSSSLNATQTYRYDEALVAGSPAIDAVSKAQDSNDWAPRWKGTALLGWKLGPLSASVDGRYVSKYQDYDSNRAIGNSWLCDANVRFEIGQSLASGKALLKGIYLEVGGVNVFNKPPQYSNFGFGFVGYDGAQADIRGRFLYLRLGGKY